MIKQEQLVVMNQHYKNFSLDYFLDAQERLGIRNIELWMSMQHFPLDSMTYGDCKRLLKKLCKRNLKVVCATFPSCDYQYQYACQDKACRQKCADYFKNGLAAAEELGAKIVTANSGWGYWNEPEGKGLEATKEILGQVVALAERKQMTIVLETLTTDESRLINNVQKLKRFIDEFHSPALKAMIDTVAMIDAKETLEQWFEAFGEDIRYMHFIDGNKSWEHLAWGDGQYPLEEFLKTIEQYHYNGYLSQELITQSYLNDPVQVDKRNLCVLNKYVEGLC